MTERTSEKNFLSEGILEIKGGTNLILPNYGKGKRDATSTFIGANWGCHAPR